MTSSFQPQARPVDTFVRQSRVAAVNTQDAFGQLASALSIINPSLRKMMESEIEKQRGIIGAEAEQAAKEIYDPTSPNYVDLYNQAIDQQFPEEAELDNTEEEWGKRLDTVSKTVNPTEALILAGRTPWFKHNFEKQKATLLGESYNQRLQTDFLTDTAVDPDDKLQQERPISSFPYTSPTFQNWLAGKRSSYIEKLDVKPYYFNKYFVPQLDKGHDAIHKLSSTEYPKQLFEQYKLINVENMKSNIADYYLLEPQGATEEVIKQNKANLRAKILRQNTEIRRLFKGENYNKILKQQINTLVQSATAIALEGDIDGARTLLNDLASYFPTNDKGTSSLTNHPAFLEESVKFEKGLIELEEDILRKKERRLEAKMEADGLAILQNPDSTEEDIVEYYNTYPTQKAQEFLNRQVIVIRPEKYDQYEDIEDKVINNEYNTLTQATRAARDWFDSTLQLPKQREQYIELIDFIEERFNGELTTLGQGAIIIEKAVKDQFIQFDGKEFKDASDGRARDDYYIEGKKKLKEWYKDNKGASKEELIDKAEEIAEQQRDKSRAYIEGVQGIDLEETAKRKARGRVFLFERVADRLEMGSDGKKPTLQEVLEQYAEYEDVTAAQIFEDYARANVGSPLHFELNEEEQKLFNKINENFGGVTTPTVNTNEFEPTGIFKDIKKSKPNDEINKSTNQNTPARVDKVVDPKEFRGVSYSVQGGNEDMTRGGGVLMSGIKTMTDKFDAFNGAVSFGSGGRESALAKDPNFIRTLEKNGFSHTYADKSSPQVIEEAKRIYADLVSNDTQKNREDKYAIAQMVVTEAIPNSEEDRIGVMQSVLMRVARARLGVNEFPNGRYEKDIIKEILRKDQYQGVTGFTREDLLSTEPIKESKETLKEVFDTLWKVQPDREII